MNNGDKITGEIKALESGQLRLSTDYAGTIVIEWPEVLKVKEVQVVTMYPVKAGFWDKVDGSLEFGFAYDKSSDVGKYSVFADAAYRTVRQDTFVSCCFSLK